MNILDITIAKKKEGEVMMEQLEAKFAAILPEFNAILADQPEWLRNLAAPDGKWDSLHPIERVAFLRRYSFPKSEEARAAVAKILAGEEYRSPFSDFIDSLEEDEIESVVAHSMSSIDYAVRQMEICRDERPDVDWQLESWNRRVIYLFRRLDEVQAVLELISISNQYREAQRLRDAMDGAKFILFEEGVINDLGKIPGRDTDPQLLAGAVTNPESWWL